MLECSSYRAHTRIPQVETRRQRRVREAGGGMGEAGWETAQVDGDSADSSDQRKRRRRMDVSEDVPVKVPRLRDKT